MTGGRDSANYFLLVLMALSLAASALDLISVQPNRIVPGEGLGMVEALGVPGTALGLMPVLVVLFLAWRPTRAKLGGQLCLVLAALLLLPWGLAALSAQHIDADQPHARIGIGTGLWSLLFVLLLALIELLERLGLAPPWRWSLMAAILVSWGMAVGVGGLDSLALVQEYRARSGQFGAAVRYHLGLVGAAVGISLVLAALLAWGMRRWHGARRACFAVLSVIQTIPSLALFGLLLAPLAYLSARYAWLAELGVRGIGWAPALIALVGYSLLPMTRNIVVALDEVPASVIESARGMGMSARQVFWQVRMPLALPVMVEGVRITAVQAIGLAAVAALIGAGGLGTFVFQGLGQAAMDLVLLGALPIILLALLVDAAISAMARYLRRGR